MATLVPRKKMNSSFATPTLIAFLMLMLMNVLWMYFTLHSAMVKIDSSSGGVVLDQHLRRSPLINTPTDINPTTVPMALSSSSSSSLDASIWTTRKLLVQEEGTRTELQQRIRKKLERNEKDRLLELCGKFLYSSITSGAIHMKPDGTAHVATGDIPDMWTRDSTVQISLLYNRQTNVATNFRSILEGTLRKNAFYIVQDPYANAYASKYKHPLTGRPKDADRVIGRGGWVATRNYELDSGAYFLNQLWDYYKMDPRAAKRLYESDCFILDAVRVLVEMWTIEQHHDSKSGYRYFELMNEGKGSESGYTGMTWTGFRPSDDACVYHYLIPANIHAAAGLERVLELNRLLWKDKDLHARTKKLLSEISGGVHKYGVVQVEEEDGSHVPVYAYEVNGLGMVVKDYDDANVPSLLSIPLLGWSGYNRTIYRHTRKHILSSANKAYFEGNAARGIGSVHTRSDQIWPLALAVQALTTDDSGEILEKIRELLKVSECKNAMHESIHKDAGCKRQTRDWFEWANALFVVLVESVLEEQCDSVGQDLARNQLVVKNRGFFYSDKYHNNPQEVHHYQGIQAFVHYDN